jgi:hypothetical protein
MPESAAGWLTAYYDFEGRDVTFTSPSSRQMLSHLNQTVHTFKFHVTLRFSPGGAPLTAPLPGCDRWYPSVGVKPLERVSTPSSFGAIVATTSR